MLVIIVFFLPGFSVESFFSILARRVLSLDRYNVYFAGEFVPRTNR